MSYGSIMANFVEDSQFDNALIKITGPKVGSTVTVTQGSTVITATESNAVWTAKVGRAVGS